MVTAKKIGTAKVTVRYRRQTAACTVTVKAAPTKLAVKGGDVVIQKGANNHKIKLQFARGTAAYTVTYKTRDSAIATVNKQGYITGKSKGKTQLTVRTYNGITARITVRVQNKALPLNANAAQLALDHNHVTQVVYGKSVQNRNLEGYIITPTNGKYKKTLFIDFAIHGFEDDYARDGQRLTAIANHLVAHFASHPEELGNYRLVIVPCANPDGAIAGKNAQRSGKNAFGRCTAAHVDINRDFGPFKGKETRALRDFILRSKPNVYINAHGWLNETLGTKKLCQIVNRTLHLNKMKDGVYAANEATPSVGYTKAEHSLLFAGIQGSKRPAHQGQCSYDTGNYQSVCVKQKGVCCKQAPFLSGLFSQIIPVPLPLPSGRPGSPPGAGAFE